MRKYGERIDATLKAIEMNPGIEITKLCASLAIELKVRIETVEGYVMTLANAGKLHADVGHLYTVEGWETKKDIEKMRQFEEEETVMQAAKNKESSPLESYDVEQA